MSSAIPVTHYRILTKGSQPLLLGPWRTSSPMSYRSNSAASEFDLARFDLRIARAMQSSARRRPDG